MARRGRKRKTLGGYFRQLFEQHPDWLDVTSNEVILDQYRRDHGMSEGANIKPKIRNNLANLKSVLRKKKGLGSYAGKRSKPAAAPPPVEDRNHLLEQLESQIDDCMMSARSIDVKGLDSVLKHLRRARYEVVWKMGAK